MPLTTVLLVEDNTADAELITRELQMKGFFVTHVFTPLDVPKGPVPDVVLLNGRFPGHPDAAENFQIVRQRISPQTPIVMILSRYEDESARKLMTLGAADVLDKDDISRGTLVRSLRLAVWRL